jgi:hypothetical protein
MNSCARFARAVLFAPVLLHVSALAADVSYYGILKVQEFVQTPSAAPAPVTDGFSFHAFVVASTNGSVTNATVRRVGTATENALLPRGGDLLFEFEQRFASQAALDTAYPNGNVFVPVNYAVTISTLNDGVQSQNLNFAAAAALGGYPTTPQIADLQAAQVIDTTREFTLRWNSLGGGSTEIVQLTIFDSQSNTVFSTPAPFQPGALNASSVSATIPPNTLPPGATLAAHLTIARPGLPNTAYATGVPAFSKDTSFPLATRPAPTRPNLSITALANGVEITFVSETNLVYHLQASPELATWSDVLVTNATSGSVRFFGAIAAPAQFYRVQVGP